MPHILGSDFAGTVAAVGENVSHYAIGDRVGVNPGIWDGTCEFCLSGEAGPLCNNFKILGEHLPGGYAEFAAVPARNLIKLPGNFGFKESAASSLVFLTAWRMLKTQVALKKNETILIIGAGGGVSSAAIQIAKHLGATVLATTSSNIKMEQTRTLGADKVYNYKENADWAKNVYLDTKKRGVDVVLDSIGASTWEQSLRSLRNGGRLVTCGATSGPIGNTNISLVFWRQLRIIGSTMATHSEFTEVMNLIFKGVLRPVISKEFPLQEAANAHQYLSRMERFGKIVLKID